MKITSSIYLVGGSSESHPADAAVYLVKTGEGAVLIDAGTGGGTQRIVKNIQAAGSDITAVSHLFVITATTTTLAESMT
jgi:glyoxylase-like metal-dependent hydrolase (beta-lactamase superfamily II)